MKEKGSNSYNFDKLTPRQKIAVMAISMLLLSACVIFGKGGTDTNATYTPVLTHNPALTANPTAMMLETNAAVMQTAYVTRVTEEAILKKTLSAAETKAEGLRGTATQMQNTLEQGKRKNY